MVLATSVAAAVTLSSTSREFGAGAGTYTFRVDSNTAWTASVDVLWVMLSRTSDSGTKVIEVSVAPNPTGANRVATITVDGVTHTLTQLAQGNGLGELWAVGSNSYGQLGDGTTVWRDAPVQVTTRVVSMASTAWHTLFLKTDGTLWAVGANGSGQLGDGTGGYGYFRIMPVQVATDVAAIAAGAVHNLFVKTDGTLWAMGGNGDGQLGDGTTTDRLTPVEVATDVTTIASCSGHSLFIKSDRTLWGMGNNSYGQLGDGTTARRITPVQITTDVAAIAAGGVHNLFVKTDGTLWAMGDNNYGQLGDGTTTDRRTPVQVATGVVTVAAGIYHSLFIKTDGTLWAMGFNSSGQLGDGTATNRSIPVQVANGVKSATANMESSLFVKTDGTLWAMGASYFHPLGPLRPPAGVPTDSRTPRQGAGHVIAVAAGAEHVLILNDGSAGAPGNQSGRLVNLSIRTQARTDAETLITGFVAGGGTENAALLVRAAGPALTPFGVPGALADPQLAIHDAVAQLQVNDDWPASLAARFAQVGAFPWTVGSKDAAIELDLTRGPCTAVIADVGGGSGVALAEIYDMNTTFDAAKPRLINVSARSHVGTGDNVMIAGFVIGGETSRMVLIRAVGPTLATYGVTGTLADPQLVVFEGQAQIAENDDWDSALAATFAAVGAFPLDAASKDAALLLTLAPGVYTAQVSGVVGETGVALVEIYAVP